MKFLPALLAVPLLLLGACTVEEVGEQRSAVVCVANVTRPCTCGIREGQQTCNERGTKLSKCSCEEASVDPSTEPAPGAGEPEPPAPVTCGNGQVDPGEACDDGNDRDDDGCSSACQPDGFPAVSDGCSGQSLVLWKGTQLVLKGTTKDAKNDLESSCVASAGPDRIYGFRPNVDGFVSIEGAFAPGFEAVVEVRPGACAIKQSTPLLCEDTMSRPFQQVFEVKRSQVYYVIVDGFLADSAGAYTLKLDLQ